MSTNSLQHCRHSVSIKLISGFPGCWSLMKWLSLPPMLLLLLCLTLASSYSTCRCFSHYYWSSDCVVSYCDSTSLLCSGEYSFHQVHLHGLPNSNLGSIRSAVSSLGTRGPQHQPCTHSPPTTTGHHTVHSSCEYHCVSIAT